MRFIALLLAAIMILSFSPAVFAYESPDENFTEISEVKFVSPKRSSPKVAVMRYFSALYDSYIAMLPVDISPIIDLDYEMMENVLCWNTLLQMRRRLISENDFCYVEKERFDYEIEYIKKRDLDDQRMDYVNIEDYGKNATILHFVIKGEEGKAYPPIFAVNSQHSVVITEENGEYKIAYHYFPGSEGKFQNDLPVTVPTESEMLSLLKKEFTELAEYSVPKGKNERLYDPEAAAAYALEYCESRNKKFHFVGDWYGNCMNFASQCVWSGFCEEGESPANTGGMTRKWYCTRGGGTLIWASVSRFWNWIGEKNSDMQVFRFYDVLSAKKGDIVHIGSYACSEPEKYTHALIIVDDEKMILAQNSPACFVYYSDLANNYARFIRPLSLEA
ncbi:MAG: amidase domain-containing protein [Oscillospiraceae bacterium]|nr:amidase domain-containing protein [Oscillospiraceae bacterium]